MSVRIEQTRSPEPTRRTAAIFRPVDSSARMKPIEVGGDIRCLVRDKAATHRLVAGGGGRRRWQVVVAGGGGRRWWEAVVASRIFVD